MFFPDVVPLVPLRGIHRRLAASPVTLALLCLTVAATVIQLAAPSLDVVENLGTGAPVGDGEWWRLVTYVFPQLLGVPHLALNATGLALYGPFLEHRIGRLGMAVTYLVAGAFGGAWLYGAGQRSFNAGASLALFGVFAALVTANLVFAREGKIPRAAFRRSLLILAALTALLWPIEVGILLIEQTDRLTFGRSFWGIVRHSPGIVAGLPLGLGFAFGKLRGSPAWPALAVAVLIGAAIAFVVYRTCPWPLWPPA